MAARDSGRAPRIPRAASCRPSRVDALDVIEELAAQAEPGVVAIPGGQVLRLRHRRRSPGRARGGLAHVDVGPERRAGRQRGPAAAVAEEVAGELGSRSCSGSPPMRPLLFVTGCQMAHVTGLAAARHELLERVGWDVERRGLAGAPPIRVFVGGKRHVTIDRALRLLGLGSDAATRIEVDGPGSDAPGAACARRSGRRRAGDRLRAGRRGEHGRDRRAPRDRRHLLDSRCLAPRRRSVRAVGRRVALAVARSWRASSAPTPGRRTRTSG